MDSWLAREGGNVMGMGDEEGVLASWEDLGIGRSLVDCGNRYEWNAIQDSM